MEATEARSKLASLEQEKGMLQSSLKTETDKLNEFQEKKEKLFYERRQYTERKTEVFD
jgi:hypothetical protein